METYLEALETAYDRLSEKTREKSSDVLPEAVKRHKSVPTIYAVRSLRNDYWITASLYFDEVIGLRWSCSCRHSYHSFSACYHVGAAIIAEIQRVEKLV